ncbi:ribonuclease HI [Caldanaerobacter subterraneus]|uniref:Ribonuclease H n=1 Tax=Caldanaerobacter subterraneus subsp. pacificus DSM 12653 TaxID=391606 RepID=A0A0F5PLZ9_9THEO|nr:ribonuclease HI [Caldanaerobacter subterraneus]KKC29687.1 ribonuclease H [Caldanaerobacter subterraneus subsp. pacificus DSM 12653]
MKNNNEIIEIYTDGACSGNPGPGGWAAVLIYKGIKKEISGFEENTTNNRMELKAAIEGLKALKRPCKVNLYSDSSYLINAFNEGWIEKWQKNNWLKSDKTPVENQDLWKELLEVSKPHQINWIKVKGHSDNEYNNLCDRLATEQIKKHIKENP